VHSPFPSAPAQRRFLFLQGPISPFFAEVAAGLRALGHQAWRINVCLGDKLVWRGPGAVDFRGRLRDWPDYIGRFLDTHRIDEIMLLGEQRSYHRIAIAAAKARGIGVTVTDYGYIRPDWIVLERDGMGAESLLPRDPEALRALAEGLPPLEPGQRFTDSFAVQARNDVAFHVASLLPWPFPHYERFTLHHPIPAYLGTGWRLLRRRSATLRAETTLAAAQAQAAATGAPLYLFAMQMETDYSVRAYSDFPDLDSAIRLAVESFARGAAPEAQLLVKVHPLDPGLKNWARRVGRIAAAAGVAGRVHFMDGLHMDPVILACRGVVTINSTVGIRSIQLGRATLPLGKAIYDVAGLAWQGGRDAFWQSAPPPDPGLTEAFIRAIAGLLQVRGVYYVRPGLDAAVAATVERLHLGVPAIVQGAG
jgi:capsular polysaccharide export protein